MTDYEDKKQFNGWANYKTWSVWATIGNMESLYIRSKAWKNAVLDGRCSKDYRSLISFMRVRDQVTYEGIKYTDKAINGTEIVDALFSEE